MADWLERISNILRLTRAGVVILVDHAWDARLPELLRSTGVGGLPELCTDFDELSELPADSTVVFVPRASQVAALNAGRPRIATRRLRIVLWCSQTVTIALARGAPDFFDWISHRVECPGGLAPHLLAGINTAARDGVRGAVCSGLSLLDEPEAQQLEDSGWRIVEWPDLRDGSLFDAVPADPCARLWVESVTDRPDLWSLRVALAADRCDATVAVNATVAPTPGWWSLDGTALPLEAARRALGVGATMWPDRELALLGGEPATIELLRRTLAAGAPAATLRELVRGRVDDAGVALARHAFEHGLVSPEAIARMDASPPVLRALSRHPRVVRAARRLYRRVERGEDVTAPTLGWYVAQRSAPVFAAQAAASAPPRDAMADAEYVYLLEAYLRRYGGAKPPPSWLLLRVLSLLSADVRAELVDAWGPHLRRAGPERLLTSARRYEDDEQFGAALEAYDLLLGSSEEDAATEAIGAAALGRARIFRRLGRYAEAMRATDVEPLREAGYIPDRRDEVALAAERGWSALSFWWLDNAWEASIELSWRPSKGAALRAQMRRLQSRLRAGYYLARGHVDRAETELERETARTRDLEWYQLCVGARLMSRRFDAALEASDRAVELSSPGTLARADVEWLRALVQVERGDPADGARLARAALEAYHRVGTETHFAGRAHRALAECLLRAGASGDALTELNAADRCLRSALPAEHPERLECHLALASLPGRDVVPVFAFAALEEVLGADHPVVVRWRERLADLTRVADRVKGGTPAAHRIASGDVRARRHRP